MQVEVQYHPDYTMAIVTLDEGEPIQTEAGAMLAMSPDMEIATQARGGFKRSLGRSLFGGESFFMNTYTGKRQGDRIALASALPGDLAVIELNDDAIMLQSSSYLASSQGIQIETKWEGAKNFFSGAGFIMLQVSGTGTLIMSSYGAIHKMTLQPGQRFIVDTGHLISFSQGMKFKIKKVGGWKSTLLSGEGLVVELEGPGEFFMQTRNPPWLISWINAHIPHDHSSNQSSSS
jgi:uncharacterized protein (TIGR00266 family)